MGYDIEPLLADCYEETTCLINKFGITDETVLEGVEAEITLAKASTVDDAITDKTYDFNHYKAMHKYLFDDIYEWAGKIRNVDISKKGTKFVNAN